MFSDKLKLRCQTYVQTHIPSLVLTAVLVSVPFVARRFMLRYRHNFTQITSNTSLIQYLQKHKEVQLRCRISSLNNESLNMTHTPLLRSRPDSQSNEVQAQNENLKGMLVAKLAGIERPYSEQSINELQHKSVGLFEKTFYLHISWRENQNNSDGEPLSVWVLPPGIAQVDLAYKLTDQGYLEITKQYKMADFDMWTDISRAHNHRMQQLQKAAKTARVGQRGIWSQYRSEF